MEGEHDCVFPPAGRRPPVRDDLFDRDLPVGGLDDLAVFGEPFDRLINLARAELGEGLTFHRILLAAVLDEFHRA